MRRAITVMVVAGTSTVPCGWTGPADGPGGERARTVREVLESTPSETLVSVDSDTDRSVEEAFTACARQWRRERSPHAGSVARSIKDPAYQAIIELGQAAVPSILRELQRRPDHWFPALAAITGANPVPEDSQGDLAKMVAAWVVWGRARGLI